MVGKARIIKDDLFGIAKRLRQIDKGYFAVFNYRHKRFEIHHGGQKGSTLCLIVPFNRLDGRVLDLVKKSRVENAGRLILEMEQSNAALEKNQRQALVKKAEFDVERSLQSK